MDSYSRSHYVRLSIEIETFISILSISIIVKNMEKTEKNFAFCLVAGDTQTEVHIDGCRDIYRGVALYNNRIGGHSGERAYQDVHVLEANTVEEALEEEINDLNADFGQGVWTKQYFTIMPCCRKK